MCSSHHSNSGIIRKHRYIVDANGQLVAVFHTRAEGGQIVAPGSMIDGKTYEIVDDSPIADACTELIELVRKQVWPSIR